MRNQTLPDNKEGIASYKIGGNLAEKVPIEINDSNTYLGKNFNNNFDHH